MGADYSSQLYLGIDISEIYKLKTESEEYDLHDPKTGKKTGKKGVESKEFYINIHTGEKYPNEIYELPLDENYVHNMAQESDEYIIGVAVASIGQYDGSYKDITPKMLEDARKKFDKVVGPHLGDKKIEPKLTLSLYCSY